MPTELLLLVYRTTILYVVALVVFRLMGKRTLAKMGAFDFAVVIMIGEAVAIGIEDAKKPLINAIGITVALGLLQYLLTWLNLRFRPLERLTQGIPTRVVYQGEEETRRLRQERVTHEDLMMGLRQKDVTQLSEVEEAYLEPTGEISVRKRSSGAGSSSSASGSGSGSSSGGSTGSGSQGSSGQSTSPSSATANQDPRQTGS